MFLVVGLALFIQRCQHLFEAHFFAGHRLGHAVAKAGDLGDLGDEQEGAIPEILQGRISDFLLALYYR